MVGQNKNNGGSANHWWGEFALQSGKWARWTIGPTEFLARSLSNEWRFAWKTSHDMLSEKVRFEDHVDIEPDDSLYTLRRYALEDMSNSLRLTPRLADRAVVVRPETPLFLPPNQRATLYVSTAVWISIEPATDSPEPLFEIPIYRSSDTWFGPSTIEGELCYNSVTNARTDSQLLAQVPHRAFTPIDISNNGEDALEIEFLRVPVTLLSLYAGSSGRLWTDQVTFEREKGESSASLRITSHDALESATEMKLSDPRETVSTGIVHSFSKIFNKAS